MASFDQFNPQFKLFKYPDRIADFLRDGITKGPTSIEISPANYCNASCHWCFYKDTQDKGGIDRTLMLDTLDELVDMDLQSLNWTGGGEPTLHPSFHVFVDKAYRLGIKQGLFTNGLRYMKADPSRFEWIRVSVIPKPDIIPYDNIERYIKEGKEIGICYSLEERDLVRKKNGETLGQIIAHLRDIGVDYVQLRPVLPVNGNRPKGAISKPMAMKDFETEDFKVHITDYKFDNYGKSHQYEQCYGHHFTPFIWETGDVAVCAYHYGDPDYIFGNLNKETFKEIWFGERRKEVMDSELVQPTCQVCCKNDQINKILWQLKDVPVKHEEFI